MSDRLIIEPYDADWPTLFVNLGASLRDALGDTAIRIDHIGATSIPGLDAEPIIDIQVSVKSFDPLDAFRVPIEKMGLVHRSGNPDPTKRYFREHPGDRRTHIHVRVAGSWPEQSALLFRDYMRVHKADVKRYTELKHRLAQEKLWSRLSYMETKGWFISEIMVKADHWAQKTGWSAGPSDA